MNDSQQLLAALGSMTAASARLTVALHLVRPGQPLTQAGLDDVMAQVSVVKCAATVIVALLSPAVEVGVRPPHERPRAA